MDREPRATSPRRHGADGDSFRHFLDSPEQGLLTLVLWSDIELRGDVVLLHPFVLHAVSQNHRGPRFITNAPIALREPLRFDRDDPAEHSVVARAVLRALRVERFEFRATGEREQVVPERVVRQRRMAEAERARPAAAERA